MIVLEAENIGKTYGEEQLLQSVWLQLRTGELTAITGKSGCGKTTLLSILGLLQRPNPDGRLFISQQETQKLSLSALARLRRQAVGFVFQRARLDGALTALENVLLPAWLFGGTKRLEPRARYLLQRLGLENRMDYRPEKLSVGQLRRIALARALLFSPPLLLADEPTNDLDEESAACVFKALLQARDQGAAVVLVTHDQRYAAMADRRLQLQDGHLTEE
jgi:ABC-type lipoprotein export system ATPase subunit